MLESSRRFEGRTSCGCPLSWTVRITSWPFAFFASTDQLEPRYLGTDPEPRLGLSSGHIPYSLSVPFTEFLQTHSSPNTSATYTTYRTANEISQVLVEALGTKRLEQILRGERAIITSCGSGMTAGVLWLGLKLLGIGKVGLYDEVSLTFRT